MGEEEHITGWTHRDLLDAGGEKIGTIEDVRFDDADNSPKWLVVKSGLLGTHRMFVPANDVHPAAGGLALPFGKERVKHAPHVSNKDFLTGDDERALQAYYVSLEHEHAEHAGGAARG